VPVENRRELLVVAAAVVLTVIAGMLVWQRFAVDTEDTGRPGVAQGHPAAEAADAFARAWRDGRLAEVPATTASGDVSLRTLEIIGTLGAQLETVTVTGLTDEADEGALVGGPDRRRAELFLRWAFDDDRRWEYDSVVVLEEDTSGEGEPVWRIDWAPAVVHPRLEEGDALTAVRLPAERGEILGLDGEPLVGLRPVVQVGFTAGTGPNPEATARQVAALVGVDGSALAERVASAPAGRAVAVVTLRREAFEPIADALRAIGGVTLTDDEVPLAPTRSWARAVVGSVGPATEEVVLALEGRVALGEITGLSGLQAAQDEVLSGRPSLSVRVVSSAGREPYELTSFPAEPGDDITITLDRRIQAAADEAVAGAPTPAALVAIRASTGDVVAVANGPAGADGFNRAMVGRYAPGSTFKVASAFALLDRGLTPDDVLDCPLTTVVGKGFRNAGGVALGEVSFREIFARSCNTTFVDQSRSVSSQELSEVASLLGFRPLEVGMPLRAGTAPVTDSEAGHAAAMIGQGQVEASPFVVALLSASVAAGRSVEPRLVVDDDAPAPGAGDPLPVVAIEALRSMMRSVVTDGTGGALAEVPGGPVHAKTGTAEYGVEVPPRTHAWVTGYQGDLAFACSWKMGHRGARWRRQLPLGS
jgi:cell division protein FtsI/penicillin-binding protein 2